MPTTPTLIDNFDIGPATAAVGLTNTNASAAAAGSGNTMTFSETGRVGNTGFSVQFDNFGVTSGYLELLTPFTGTRAVFKGRVRFEDYEHTSDWRFAAPRNGTSNLCHLCLTPAGNFSLRNSGGVSISGSSSDSAALFDTNYDWILAVKPGTDTVTGEIEYWILEADTETILHNKSFTGVNTGVLLADRIRLGTNAVLAGGGRHWIDRLLIESLATGRILEGTVNFSPNVEADLNLTNVEPGSLVRIGVVATVDEGRIISYAASAPGLTLSGSGNYRSFEAPMSLVNVTYTVTWTVTSGTGATTTDTQLITVLACTITVAQGGVHVPAVLRA